jgi:hypothetical protein
MEVHTWGATLVISTPISVIIQLKPLSTESLNLMGYRLFGPCKTMTSWFTTPRVRAAKTAPTTVCVLERRRRLLPKELAIRSSAWTT